MHGKKEKPINLVRNNCYARQVPSQLLGFQQVLAHTGTCLARAVGITYGLTHITHQT
jgi:hypothetical protein